MTELHLITREIGIDAGHRVPDHGSKCRNLHGHRYTIQATCSGPLFTEGEQKGMVLDFGFLKDLMMREIDAHCDHGLILYNQDPLLPLFLGHNYAESILDSKEAISGAGVFGGLGKLYIVPFVPTAENLAWHWFSRMAAGVVTLTQGQAQLRKVKVWETPNCSSEYPT